MANTIHNYQPYAHVVHLLQDILDTSGEVDSFPFYIRDMEPSDLLLLDLREEQKKTLTEHVTADWAVRAHAWINLITPMNYAIFHGHELLMLITIKEEVKGVADVSFLTDTNFVSASRAVKIAIIKAMHRTIMEIPFHRIQAKVDSTFVIGRNFVEKMGLTEEGVLKSYGHNGDDYIMYGLVK